MEGGSEETAQILPSENGNSMSTLRKEPSFSRWCFDTPLEEAILNSRQSVDLNDGDSGFELPLLRPQDEDTAAASEDTSRETENLNGMRQRSLSMTEKGDNCAGGREDLNGNKSGPGIFSIEYKENGVGSIKLKDFDELETKVGEVPLKDSNIGSLLFSLIRPFVYIILWYTFSTCLTLYNKLLVGEKMGNFSLLGEKMGKFPAPLLMNTIHFSMQGLVSTIVVRFCFPGLRPQAMTWKDYFSRGEFIQVGLMRVVSLCTVVPTAVATALDIDLSNVALIFISVTFSTMCKSSAPVFLLLFAFAFKLETPSYKLLGIIFVISFGVMLTVAKSTEFNFWGFAFVMMAALMSGFRWTVTQILLQKEEYGLTNPFAVMSYLTPVMALITAIFSLITEPWSSLSKTRYFDTRQHLFQSSLLMLLGGSLAFFMVLTEYLLISATSAVTFTVAGIVKEVVTIVVAVFFFHDHFTILKGVGLAVIIIGVCLFNWYKYQKLKKNPLNESSTFNMDQNRVPARYVILEDMDDDEGTESEAYRVS
ncbi:probable sugar phosphate/phosphate translocator At1g06470 isoform X1 [Cryptomeria japonica]|uniref:probable sugar phosphate/phosphate translocator At1g06470 isoform X1 n=2 Tax=Cryptomeria japonica TaxID=3369 RepID=UPI0027DA242C|nr:probable sugar phosphate/phosphate translocator At1g06470 isoform X1 [Cryptomeria japonica]